LKRDLQLAIGAAAATVVPGIVLWGTGAPSVLALLASLAVAVIAVLALARRWYRQIIVRIDAQTLRLQSAIGVASSAGDIPIYWSGHAITPEALKLIQHLVESLQVRSILELGSGISTLLLANGFRRRGSGHVLSLDDDPRWAEQTAARLAQEKLDGFAEVRVAPLVDVEVGGHRGKWYDLAAIDAQARFDLIVVDGPPAWQGDDMARLPALYRLRPVLSDNGILVLDDAARPGERAIAQQWQRDFPELHFRMVRTGRGLFVASVQRSSLDLLPDQSE
jgi:predicted O-methyltransferase YrrM